MSEKSLTTGVARQLVADGFGWVFQSTFLAHLDGADREAILASSELSDSASGTALLFDGQPNDWVLLFLCGEAQAERAGPGGVIEILGRIGPGQLIGERSVVERNQASATVRARSDVRCLRIPGREFRELHARSEALRSYIGDLIALRAKSSEVRQMIARQPILRALDNNGVERFLQSGRILRFLPGERVVARDELTREAYLLLKGRLRVSIPTGDGTLTFHSQGPGWFFGHAAELLDSARTADIVSLDSSEVLQIPAAALQEQVGRNPRLYRLMLDDLRQSGVQVRPAREQADRSRLVAVYGSRPRLGTTTLAYGIAGAIGARCLVDLNGAQMAARLNAPVVQDREGEIAVLRFDLRGATATDSLDSVRVIWPERLEDLVALLAHLQDSAPPRSFTVCTAETRMKAGDEPMARADMVVYMRSADDSVHPNATQRHQMRIDAVRIRPGSDASGHVNSPIRVPDDPGAVRAFTRTGDLSLLCTEDGSLGSACQRITRKLMGTTVGLALGGGGALGYGHVGLIRALHEARIPIDYVAGSSFGALVAGLYAAEGEAGLTQLVERWSPLRWSALRAFWSTAGFQGFVDEITGGKTLGETRIPFFPVALDVESGSEVVPATGTVGRGVRLSSGLPGAYPAMVDGTRRLVDGGINNNVPASVVKAAGADFIIASNIIPSFPFRGQARSNWSRRVPFASRVDSVVRSLFCLMSQNGRDRSSWADYTFNFEIDDVSVYSFHEARVIADKGEAQARREMAEIRFAYEADLSRLFDAPV